MYLAMNRFTVPAENAGEFEQMWLSRESHLQEMEGFVEFHMLRGPQQADTILYASHTVWRDEASFQAWTKSRQFRDAHAGAGAGDRRKLFSGHPTFEGFSAFQHIGRSTDSAA